MTEELKQKTRLLAINFGGIGDEILFLPTLKSIKKYYPNWHITLLLEPRSKSIAQVTDLIDDVLEFDIKKMPLLGSDLIDLLGLLRNGNFDISLSSGSTALVSVLLFLSGIPTRIGYGTSLISRRLLTNSVRLNYNQYAASMYHDLVKGLGINDHPSIPAINLEAKSTNNILAALEKIGLNTTSDAAKEKPFNILIHPGTSKLAIQKGIIKTWGIDSWAHLIAQLVKEKNVQVLLAGGPDDKEIVKAIKKQCSEIPSFYSIAGLTKNLSELAALINFCDLLVCVDSAPMHVAVGLDKPVVALFGPTDEHKLLPAGPKFKAIRGLQNQYGVNVTPNSVLQTINEFIK